MKVAIVHDFLNQYGGAERTLESIHRVFPEAPVFTTFFLPESLPPVFSRMDVRTSFMQRLPFLRRHFKKYLPLYPLAVRSLDLSGFELILSSSSAFAKGVRIPPGGVHVCYCYTPMRFAWDPRSYLSRERMLGVVKAVLSPLLAWLRRWDLESAPEVDHFLAISEHIRDRIGRAYGRPSEVIPPPVDVGAIPFSGEKGDYYLVLSRLNAYKRIDLAVEACNRMGAPLVVAGEGAYGDALRRMAGPTVRFTGWVSDAERGRLLAGCRAFLFPGEEDFGIAPVEAMAAGRPVVAYGAGGALETVVDGETGLFFREQTADSLVEALRRFEGASWDARACRDRALIFDKPVFEKNFKDRVLALFATARKKG
jgi:glycosyltransferase involved in cell wall biosynthesis